MDDIKDIDNSLIEDLGLSPRTLNILKRNGLFTIVNLKEYFQNNKLEKIKNFGEKSLSEVSNALNIYYSESSKYQINRKLYDKPTLPRDYGLPTTWAEMTQSYFESEREKYSYILLSRLGFQPKKLQEIASEFGVSRERIRKIREVATRRFIKQISLTGSNQLLIRILEIFNEYGESLSLEKFEGILQEENLIGGYSPNILSKLTSKIDPFDILIFWLTLLSDSRFSRPPIVFPVSIKTLTASKSVAIKDYKNTLDINRKLRRKIMHEVYFTGGISIYEASKILSKDSQKTESILRGWNLTLNSDNRYVLKSSKVESENLRP